jgi:hypothetical protein
MAAELNSLTAVGLQSRVAATFSVSLPATEALDYPAVRVPSSTPFSSLTTPQTGADAHSNFYFVGWMVKPWLNPDKVMV